MRREVALMDCLLQHEREREREREDFESLDPHNWKNEIVLSRDREDRRGAHVARKANPCSESLVFEMLTRHGGGGVW